MLTDADGCGRIPPSRGDCINSPYIGIGVEPATPEAGKLFALANNQHQKTTADVAQYGFVAFACAVVCLAMVLDPHLICAP